MSVSVESSQSPETIPTQEPLPLSGTILVVDDDQPVRVMLARLLRAQGYTVVQATSATEARKVLERQRPDLLISDIVMPGESGIDLRRHVADRWPGLPVILVSGYSSEGPAEFASRTPDTRFVQKPFAAEDLLALIHETLSEGP
ncbi:MAG TPA: response regulator [Tepidiformaceae bacterium]|jgi:DNA-binding NtrC family response regulator|nr:response regulator [Tepidiformaceae bacterium]